MDKSVFLVFGAALLLGFSLVNAQTFRGWNENSLDGRMTGMMNAMHSEGKSHEVMHAQMQEWMQQEGISHEEMHEEMANEGFSHSEMHERMHGGKLTDGELQAHCGNMVS